jgi:hypothetical protein
VGEQIHFSNQGPVPAGETGLFHVKAMSKPKGGRPLKAVNAQQVEALARIGCKDVDIAEICQCSVATLTRRFDENLRKGRENLHKRLRQKQIEVALKGNVVMLIWLGKQYLGQSDKQEVAMSGGVKIIRDSIP